MKPYLAICAIVRNEGRYIHEWLSYHRAVGVERFTLYDNGSTDNTLAEVARFGPVDVIPWPGEAQQLPAYRHMLEHRAHTAEWCAFIDVDEFLLPTGPESVRDVLMSLQPDCDSVFVNWMFFGSNGHTEHGDAGVLQRFTQRAYSQFPPNLNGKCIVRLDRGCQVINPHLIGARGRILSPSGWFVDVDNHGAQLDVDHQHLALAHFFTKSEAEWVERRARGRPALPLDHPQAVRTMDQFRSHDRNEVEDTRLRDLLMAGVG